MYIHNFCLFILHFTNSMICSIFVVSIKDCMKGTVDRYDLVSSLLSIFIRRSVIQIVINFPRIFRRIIK